MLRRMITGCIRGYQVAISPLLPASCRYTPSCSEYARVAVERFGPWRGGWIATRRLLRCHPIGGSGFDPVPERTEPGGEPHHVSAGASNVARQGAAGADV
jgi:putative membrane protein insertion efficiency factor